MIRTLQAGEPLLLLALLHDTGWHETARTQWRPALGKPTLKELQFRLGTDAYGYALLHYLKLTSLNYTHYYRTVELNDPLATQLALLETAQLDYYVLQHSNYPQRLLLTINRNQQMNGVLTPFTRTVPETRARTYEQITRQMVRLLRRTIWQTACNYTPQKH